MKLSVVIAAFNGGATIGMQLEALARQQWDQPWEVVVADNGSTDNTLAIVQRFRDERLPNLRIVDASARRGQPYALNLGVTEARADAVAICDADDEVAPGWLAAMGGALSKYDCVACRLDFNKLNPSWLREIFNEHPQQNNGLLRAWYPPYLWHAGGCSLGVKKQLHAAVGGFDESLPYQHDTDFCFKVQLQGVEIQFVRDAVLHYRCRPTLSAIFQQARHWSEYNILLYKYYRSFDQGERQPWRTFIRQCKNLVLSLPQIHRKEGRALWVWNLGWQTGTFIGVVKHLVPPV